MVATDGAPAGIVNGTRYTPSMSVVALPRTVPEYSIWIAAAAIGWSVTASVTVPARSVSAALGGVMISNQHAAARALLDRQVNLGATICRSPARFTGAAGE